jgi:hypothetical protein
MTYDHRVKINGTWVEPGVAYVAPAKPKPVEKEQMPEDRQRNTEPSPARGKKKLDVDD